MPADSASPTPRPPTCLPSGHSEQRQSDWVLQVPLGSGSLSAETALLPALQVACLQTLVPQTHLLAPKTCSFRLSQNPTLVAATRGICAFSSLLLFSSLLVPEWEEGQSNLTSVLHFLPFFFYLFVAFSLESDNTMYIVCNFVSCKLAGKHQSWMITIHQSLNLDLCLWHLGFPSKHKPGVLMLWDRTVHSCYSFGPNITKLPVSNWSIQSIYIYFCAHVNGMKITFSNLHPRGKKSQGSSSAMMRKDEWLTQWLWKWSLVFSSRATTQDVQFTSGAFLKNVLEIFEIFICDVWWKGVSLVWVSFMGNQINRRTGLKI